MKAKTLLIVFCLLVTGCIQITSQPNQAVVTETPSPEPASANMPNPASVFCEEKGYTSEIRTAADGSQSGVCIFPDGSECDEWALYRGECTPASQGGSTPNPASVFCEQLGNILEIRTAPDGSQSGVCILPDGSECDEWAYFRGECKPVDTETPTGAAEYDSYGWKIYTDESHGFSFHYPAEAQVITNDEPLKSLYIYGPGMGTESWGISYASDREEYRPPLGVDLLRWLTDHYLLGEVRMADVQIAGMSAIHFRHERSPQSYADDRYYFAREGQLYMILIGHSGEVEDWDLNNRFLQSFEFEAQASNPDPTAIPTALPIDPVAYQDWQTYTHPVYNFSIRLPDDWVVEEVAWAGPGMEGHILNLHSIDASQRESIRLTFRRIGEDTMLWPTGVGQGDFITQGALDIAGQPAQRVLLVCPTGDITSIWYVQSDDQPNITRGDLEFVFIFTATPTHCEAGYSLSGESQRVGETIIASLTVP